MGEVWAWCGQCMEPIGPAYHPTWRGAMDAAEALVVRDCLAQEHYETLTRPWVSVVGKVHPDDEDPT